MTPNVTKEVQSLIGQQKGTPEGKAFWEENVYGASDEVIPDYLNPLWWLDLITKYWYIPVAIIVALIALNISKK